MAGPARPDLIILGQVTVDDVVPASPGPWARQIGGSSLYVLAGARLWLAPERIGLVARTGRDYPFDLKPILATAGLRHLVLHPIQAEHLVEWLIYEPDGSRRSLPRNADLLDIGAEGAAGGRSYRDKLLEIAPTAEDIPAAWLPAKALHICPQVGSRHGDALRALRARCDWISVDPSPHYSRGATLSDLVERLAGADALLPSEQELESLLRGAPADEVVLGLHRAGFPEVVLKRGGRPVVFAHDGAVTEAAVEPAVLRDPTGAGDSFCGAYAACRLLGFSSQESVRRAVKTAALVVGCSGIEAALQLRTPAL